MEMQDRYLGRTPLHWAVLREDESALIELLEQGADPDAQDFNGSSPVHYACNLGATSLLRLLLRGGGSPEAPDRDGATPLYEAAASYHYDAVAVLLEAGADIDALNDDMTALHQTNTYTRLSAAQMLLAAGADPDRASSDGTTPLHLAAMAKDARMATTFLAAGASPNAFSASLHRPLDQALENDAEKAARAILASPRAWISIETWKQTAIPRMQRFLDRRDADPLDLQDNALDWLMRAYRRQYAASLVAIAQLARCGAVQNPIRAIRLLSGLPPLLLPKAALRAINTTPSSLDARRVGVARRALLLGRPPQ